MSFKSKVGNVRTLSARVSQHERLSAGGGETGPDKQQDGKKSPKPVGDRKVSNPEAKARFKQLAGRATGRGRGGMGMLMAEEVSPVGGRMSRQGASPLPLGVPGEEVAGLGVGSDSGTASPSRLSMDMSGMGGRSGEMMRYQAQLAQQQAVYQKQEVAKEKAEMYNDSTMLSAIPFLPIPVAAIFLILNIILPGVGTMLSGIAVMFCGTHRVKGTLEDRIVTSLCVNFMVGVSQLCTVTFLLVGWFWSISWGINMVSLALEHREGEMAIREKELTAIALTAFGGSKNIFGRRADAQKEKV